MSAVRTLTLAVTDPVTGEHTAASGTCCVQDPRFGAAVPVTGSGGYPAAIAGFEALTGQPLALYRAEGLGSPVPASITQTRLRYAPAGCRLMIDLQPALGGSDGPAVASLLASVAAAGFTDTRVSIYHEEGGLTPAQYIAVFQATAPLIHAAGMQAVYCLDSYQIAVKGDLAAYYPGDAYADQHCHDFYLANGLAALPLAAAFADQHGKPLGACEFSVQSTSPAGANYGTPAQNKAYLAAFISFFQNRWDTGIPVGDLAYWQGTATDGSDFTLTGNPYALPYWQQAHALFNTTGQMAP